MDERERIGRELFAVTREFRARVHSPAGCTKNHCTIELEHIADWHLARVREARAQAFEEAAVFCGDRGGLTMIEIPHPDCATSSAWMIRQYAKQDLAAREREVTQGEPNCAGKGPGSPDHDFVSTSDGLYRDCRKCGGRIS